MIRSLSLDDRFDDFSFFQHFWRGVLANHLVMLPGLRYVFLGINYCILYFE